MTDTIGRTYEGSYSTVLSLLNTTLLSFLCSQEWCEAEKTALTPTCSFLVYGEDGRLL
jgi:hypothetical protein